MLCTMNDDERGERLPQRWSCLDWTVCGLLLLLGIGLSLPAFVGVAQPARQSEGSNNCRQIIMFLKQYAADHGGQYPDSSQPLPQSSNQAFRVFWKEAIIEEEKVFSCPVSAAKFDHKIGSAPDFLEAVAKGECHWAMTQGLSDSGFANAPLVFETPAQPSWPPVWNADVASQPVWGRSWKRGKIIIGRNDGSVRIEKLAAEEGSAVPLAKDAQGLDLFTRFKLKGRYLDVER
jgi:hypothetical protein